MRRLAGQFNAAGNLVRREGRQFAIHNHWWECEPLPGGGAAIDLFLEELDPAIEIEFDAYWAAVAGMDPVATAARIGPRLGLLHLKDGPISRHEPMTPLGRGGMDLAPILAAAAPRWAVVELDDVVGDPFAAIEESLATLRNLGLSP